MQFLHVHPLHRVGRQHFVGNISKVDRGTGPNTKCALSLHGQKAIVIKRGLLTKVQKLGETHPLIFFNNPNNGNYDGDGVDGNIVDDQDDDRNDNDGTGCMVGEAGVCTDPDQTLHLSVLALLGRVIMMIAMMLIEV